ncbi:hypothetical protein VNO77_06203 [Canavalia gladiata]|uniref:Uncharacterized protein n=1 Tax=Canavalia gladiata TaxID=3824 RepID=A0AAN9MC27_CANGL
MAFHILHPRFPHPAIIPVLFPFLPGFKILNLISVPFGFEKPGLLPNGRDFIPPQISSFSLLLSLCSLSTTSKISPRFRIPSSQVVPFIRPEVRIHFFSPPVNYHFSKFPIL